jgi:hypothetical protein
VGCSTWKEDFRTPVFGTVNSGVRGVLLLSLYSQGVESKTRRWRDALDVCNPAFFQTKSNASTHLLIERITRAIFLVQALLESFPRSPVPISLEDNLCLDDLQAINLTEELFACRDESLGCRVSLYINFFVSSWVCGAECAHVG